MHEWVEITVTINDGIVVEQVMFRHRVAVRKTHPRIYKLTTINFPLLNANITSLLTFSLYFLQVQPPPLLKHNMSITIQQETQPHAVPRQPSTHTDSFLTKLPRELRDMIYKQVFSGDHEIVIPHPLTQTSKQLREEVVPIAARDIASRAALKISCEPCSPDFEVYTSLSEYDPKPSRYH